MTRWKVPGCTSLTVTPAALALSGVRTISVVVSRVFVGRVGVACAEQEEAQRAE